MKLHDGWSAGPDGSMKYSIIGWEIRCGWYEVNGGWAIGMRVVEVDPVTKDQKTVLRVTPSMDGSTLWERPDRGVMEELSKRIGPVRVGQIVRCAESTQHKLSTNVKFPLDRYAPDVV